MLYVNTFVISPGFTNISSPKRKISKANIILVQIIGKAHEEKLVLIFLIVIFLFHDTTATIAWENILKSRI